MKSKRFVIDRPSSLIEKFRSPLNFSVSSAFASAELETNATLNYP
jgi:hypothetical protein